MYERGTRRRGRHQPRGESELLAKTQGGWFRREDGVGAAVDCTAADGVGADETAEAVRCLEQDERDPSLGKLERGCEARYAAADDCDHVQNAEC